MNPWCTVVVPLFNGERYLHKFLSSLHEAADDYCTYLFIDDASIDNSAAIVLASGLPRKQLFRNQHNLGLYATINKALNYVQSDYVCLLFQDDIIENVYFKQMQQLTAAYSDTSFLWAETTIIDDSDIERARGLNTGRVEVIAPGVSAWRDVLKRGTFWTISGSVSKTSRLRYHGFRPELPHCGGYEFLLRAIRKDTFLYFERPLTRIRLHTQQASTRNLKTSVDIRERMYIYRDQRVRFRKDFDYPLRLCICWKEMSQVTRRALGQTVRRQFRQAAYTISLLPSVIDSMTGNSRRGRVKRT